MINEIIEEPVNTTKKLTDLVGTSKFVSFIILGKKIYYVDGEDSYDIPIDKITKPILSYIKKNQDEDTIREFVEDLGYYENMNDILNAISSDMFFGMPVGSISKNENEEIIIQIHNTHGNYINHPMINKLADFFDVDCVYDDLYQRQCLNKSIDIGYHGTAISNLKSILRFGLIPGRMDSKWSKEINYDKNRVYLTTYFRLASFHAEVDKRHKNDVYGVVIKTKIPDVSLITYDMDIKSVIKDPKLATKQSYRLGVFGYDGRIPASMIIKMYIIESMSYNKLDIIYETSDINDEQLMYFMDN
jgi:hypothetical protein